MEDDDVVDPSCARAAATPPLVVEAGWTVDVAEERDDTADVDDAFAVVDDAFDAVDRPGVVARLVVVVVVVVADWPAAADAELDEVDTVEVMVVDDVPAWQPTQKVLCLLWSSTSPILKW